MANTPHCHRSSISNHPAKRRVNYCTFCHCHQQLCQALTRRPTTILLSFTTNQNPSKQLATPQIPFKHCNSIITIQLTLPILISSSLSKKKNSPNFNHTLSNFRNPRTNSTLSEMPTICTPQHSLHLLLCCVQNLCIILLLLFFDYLGNSSWYLSCFILNCGI